MEEMMEVWQILQVTIFLLQKHLVLKENGIAAVLEGHWDWLVLHDHLVACLQHASQYASARQILSRRARTRTVLRFHA